ncbi:MAG TPA: RES family NAD+ phosphorylase [Pelomicrobium sp.]|nr:RES family NAD+ phosphorylase [Pelomicrobium sp.]
MFEGTLRVVQIRGDLVRNIKTARVAQDLYDDLSVDPDDWRVAMAAEDRGHTPAASATITRPFDYGTVLTYSFDAAHWQATRFSDGRSYGVWYGSLELETTVYETVYHWHRFVMDSYAAEDRVIVGERRVFDVHCDAALVDLRGEEARHPDLVNRKSYAFTHQVGRYLQGTGVPGLLVNSARCRGVNAALFRPDPLSNVRDRAFLTYRCNPKEDRVRVERTPGRRWLEIRPSALD